MFARSKRSSLTTLRLFTFTSFAVGVCALPLPAWAQADDEDSPSPSTSPGAAQEDEGAEAEQEAKARSAAPDAPEPAKAAAPATATQPEGDVGVGEGSGGLFPSKMHLGWDGNAEMDIGYARYGFEASNSKPERFYDFRGRFVLGPVLQYDFDPLHYFRVTGQLVAWIREEAQRYQVNVDDVYFQFGRKGVWDVQLGRFFAWRVYHRGLGFDLYTLEDTGAMKQGPFNQGIFGVKMYEVNANFWRDMAGKVAAHFYPLDVLGIELLGVYGTETQTTNVLGARAAVDLNLKFLRVMAAAEYRKREPSEDTQNPNGGDRTLIGFGGGAIVSLGPVELAGNVARSNVTNYQLNAMPDPAGSSETTTFGGYLQLDPGTLLFQRSLLVGLGINRTEQLLDNQDFERHDQGAAFIAYPLGFNDAMVKLVLSKADLLFEDVDPATGVGTLFNSDMIAGRVRLRCSF